jgi:methylated-DNA-protein-cysteine methyltransferase-like protein
MLGFRRARADGILSGVAPSPADDRRARILAVVDSIPRGKVATYGQVAREASLPRNARLVGRVLGTLPSGTRLPWHRVVAAGGRIAARPHAALQRRRLAREGVASSPQGRIDLARFQWRGLGDEPERKRAAGAAVRRPPRSTH